MDYRKGYMIVSTVVFMACLKETEGTFIITADKSPVHIGDNVTLTCVSYSPISGHVSWLASRYGAATQTLCIQRLGKCYPATSFSDRRYIFSFEKARRSFFMKICGAESADDQTLRCGYSSDRGQYELTVAIKSDCDGVYCKICPIGWCIWVFILIVIVWTVCGVKAYKSGKVFGLKYNITRIILCILLGPIASIKAVTDCKGEMNKKLKREKESQMEFIELEPAKRQRKNLASQFSSESASGIRRRFRLRPRSEEPATQTPLGSTKIERSLSKSQPLLAGGEEILGQESLESKMASSKTDNTRLNVLIDFDPF